MVVNNLTEALKNKIIEAVKDFRLPVKNGEARCPNVFIGDLPLNRMGEGAEKQFPFVIIRATKGQVSHTEGMQETTVALIIGCYSDEFEAYALCINVMQRITAALSTLPNDTLDNRYILQDPIDWNVFQDPAPQCQIDLYTKWQYCSPQVVLDI